MRRADDRRSASAMISSSIRWSLAGNDVDWIMKTSEPRTFSRTSTKISLSAKRRTLALVSGKCSQSAISRAREGLELPATSLMEPVLADIDASPRAPLDTTFNISQIPMEPARFDVRGDIKEGAWLATHRHWFSGVKSARKADFALSAGGVAQRADAVCAGRGWGLFRTCDRRPAQAGDRRWRRIGGRRAVDHGGKPAEAG